jgi:hypothetical protein
MAMTREEHLDWAKQRALRALDYSDDIDEALANAFASLASDLTKHDELQDHAALKLGTMLLMGGHLSTKKEMREFIEGCR